MALLKNVNILDLSCSMNATGPQLRRVKNKENSEARQERN